MKNHKREKIKVMTIFGTRPEIIRLSRVFAELDKYTNHIMVHTGQSYDYEMSQVFFNDFKIRKPDYFLGVKAKTLGKQIANIISKSEKVLKKEKPEALVILGDTNSSLSAIVAKRMKIPVFHMEAGNRCFDENVPEELNRKIIDHISDINLPYTENARLYLIREGIPPETIFVTGSPFAEIIDFYKRDIEKSRILEKLKLKKKKYFVASIHREENVENKRALKKLLIALNAIAQIYNFPIIADTHPRTRLRIDSLKIKTNRLIRFLKPFGYFDYAKLQKNAFCILSDSGTVQEESSLLNFPAIQIRESSERPEGFDKGILILTGHNKEIIIQAINIVVSQFKEERKIFPPKDYLDKNVSLKVVRLIVGLTRIIKKRKYLCASL